MFDEMIQQNTSKFAIFLEYKNPCIFFHFSFHATLFFPPNKCPSLCQHRPGHSLGEIIKLHDMKDEKIYMGFHITKVWQILKRFTGTFHQA